MLKNYNNKIVLGVIGLGVGAFHLKNSLKYKNCHVKYICDTDQKKLLFYKKKLNIKHATPNFNEIVNDDEVNTIIIASNDKDHFYQVSSALMNNKHVFVEKPMCLSMKELNSIIKIKKKKPNLIISSNLLLRTHPFFKKINSIKKKIEKNLFFRGRL